MSEKNIPNVIIKTFGYPDVFVEHGTPQELEEKYRLDEKSVYNYIKKQIKYRKNNYIKKNNIKNNIMKEKSQNSNS